MPTKIFNLEKIQAVREAREAIDIKWAELEEDSAAKRHFDKELEDLKKELRTEFKSVKDLVQDLQCESSDLEERLCDDVETLTSKVKALGRENIQTSNEVGNVIRTLDGKIDELKAQNREFVSLIRCIKEKCYRDRFPGLLRPLATLTRDDDRWSNAPMENSYMSVAPSDELRGYACMSPIPQLMSAKPERKESEMEKLRKEVKAELGAIQEELEQVSQCNKDLEERVKGSVRSVRGQMKEFADDDKSLKKGLKKQVQEAEVKVETLLDNNKDLRDDILFVRDNFPEGDSGKGADDLVTPGQA